MLKISTKIFFTFTKENSPIRDRNCFYPGLANFIFFQKDEPSKICQLAVVAEGWRGIVLPLPSERLRLLAVEHIHHT